MAQSKSVEAVDRTAPWAQGKIRTWFPVVLLVAYWAFIFAVYSLQLAMFTRFITRMIALGLLMLLLLGWWLTNRRFSFRDRLLAIGVMILCWVGASLLSDPTVGFMMLMMAFPFFATAGVAWLLLTKNRPLAVQRLGYCLITAITFGYFALIRWDGLDGAQHSQTSWRWSPTPEMLFLESKKSEAAQASVIPNEAAEKPWTVQPGDWPEFRGEQRDNLVTGIKVATDWKDNPPKAVWRQRVGPGWSSVIVVDGHLVTQEQRGESEAVVCYEAATGKEIWAHTDEARFFEGLSGAGPRATPTFHDGRIYTLGASGKLNCLEAATGKLLWSHDISAEAKSDVPQWGFSASPLVTEGLVLVFAGGEHDRSLLAYRADTGEFAWARAGGPLSYSSPQLASIDGQRQLLMQDNLALVAVSFDGNTVLWKRASNNAMAMPMLQVHPLGANELLIQSDPGIARIEIRKEGDQWTAVDRWESIGLKPSFNDFVVYDGHIYGLDDGILCGLDLETGKRLWKGGRYGHGQMLLLADQAALLIVTETGEVALVAANAKRHEELARFQAIEGKTWNHPVIAHGRLYVRNGEEMACYPLKVSGEE